LIVGWIVISPDYSRSSEPSHCRYVELSEIPKPPFPPYEEGFEIALRAFARKNKWVPPELIFEWLDFGFGGKGKLDRALMFPIADVSLAGCAAGERPAPGDSGGRS